jgi:hypothetical protein
MSFTMENRHGLAVAVMITRAGDFSKLLEAKFEAALAALYCAHSTWPRLPPGPVGQPPGGLDATQLAVASMTASFVDRRRLSAGLCTVNLAGLLTRARGYSTPALAAPHSEITHRRYQ